MLAGHVVPRGTRLVSEPAARAVDPLRPTRPRRTSRSGRSRSRRSPTCRTAARWPQPASRTAPWARGSRALRLTLRRASARARSPTSRSTGSTSTSATGRARRRSSTPLFGACGAVARATRGRARTRSQPLPRPAMVGIARRRGADAAHPAELRGLPAAARVFLMPERFHFARLDGLRPVVARCCGADGGRCSCSTGPRPSSPTWCRHDLALFATPIVNLFERECNVFEIDAARTAPGAARRPHPAARLRDLPRDHGRGCRRRRTGRGHPLAVRPRPEPRQRLGLFGGAAAAPADRGRAPPGPDADLLCRRRRLCRAVPARRGRSPRERRSASP